MKRFIFLVSALFIFGVCFSTNANAQVTYYATHPHHHLYASVTMFGDEEEASLFIDGECSDEVTPVYTEFNLWGEDLNGNPINIAGETNSSYGSMELHALYALNTSNFQSLHYFFMIYYSDGTYEEQWEDY